MPLEIGSAFREGVEELTEQSGLAMVGSFFVVSLVNAVLWLAFWQAVFRRVESIVRSRFGTIPADIRPSYFTFQQMLEAETLVSVDLSIPVALAGLVVLGFLAEFVHIVAVRVFADSGGGFPADVARRPVRATINGFLGGILTSLLVFVGLVLLVIPGIFLAVALVFVRQEIALEDANFVTALGASWSHTAGNRLVLFVLGIGLFLLTFVAQAVSGFVPGDVGQVVTLLVGAAVTAFISAVVTRAYVQVCGRGGQSGESTPGAEARETPA